MIATTLGWCPCHVFGLVEDRKAKATQFLRDKQPSMNFPGWWYLNRRKLIHMLYPFYPLWSKFLNKGKMQQVPPRLASHTDPVWAAGLHGLHRAAATLLNTSFWLERSWPVPTKGDSIPRSGIIPLPCDHVALRRQKDPVPCFYRESAFPGLSAPSCTLAWLSKREKTSSAPSNWFWTRSGSYQEQNK